MENYLNELRHIGLENIRTDDLLSKLKHMPEAIYHSITLPPGQSIVRTRRNSTNGYFTHPHQISHITDPKKHKSIRIGRANDDGEAIFYGSIPYPNSDIITQFGSLIETKGIQGYPTETAEELYTIGHWKLTRPLKTVVLPHFEHYHKKNPYLGQLNRDYLRILDKESLDFKRDSILASTFFALEFAKDVLPHKIYDYKLSVTFRKLLWSRGLKGIIYPSVRLKGEVLNIAIDPSIIDFNGLTLKEVYVSRIIRQGAYNLIYPEMTVKEFGENGKFIYRETNISPQEMRRQFRLQYPPV